MARIQVSSPTLLIEYFAHRSANSQLITNVVASNAGITTNNAIPQFTTNAAGVTTIAGEHTFPSLFNNVTHLSASQQTGVDGAATDLAPGTLASVSLASRAPMSNKILITSAPP